MTKQAFRATGSFQMGRKNQTFSVEVVGVDEAGAREAVLADLGSRHGVPRRLVTIEDVQPVADADIQDPITRKRIEKA